MPMQAETRSFTTPGSTTWTAPAGVTEVTVEAWGGGGRGGSRTNNGFGGGGGGGAYTRHSVTVTPGQTYTVHVGAGATTTAAGGDSFFHDGSTVLAKGGASAGDNVSAGALGGAAAGGVGSVRHSGGNGAAGTGGNGGGGGSSAGTESAGNPGSGRLGGAAPTAGGAGGNGADSAGDGEPGLNPGGGGGGSRVTANTPRIGGRGADGQVVLSYEVAVPADELAVTDQVLTEAQGLVGGGCIYRPMPGVINQLGQVSFQAYAKVGTGDVLPSDDALVLTNASGDMRVIAREGMRVDTGSASALVGVQSCLHLNDLGQTLFFDRIASSGVTLDQAYFLSDDGVHLELFTRTGDGMQGGGSLKPPVCTLVGDAAGRWYFSNSLSGAGVTTKTNTAIWQEEGGTLSLLAREGADLSALTGDPAWLGNVSTKLSGAGDGVAFIASLQNHPTLATRRTNCQRNEVVLDGNEAGLAIIARKGDVAPDTDGQTLLTLLAVARSSTGAHAIQARLKNSPTVAASNDMVLLFLAGGTSKLVAREGVTRIEGLPVRTLRAFYAIGDDEVIFLSDRALCRWTEAGGIQVLASIGGAAPGLAGNYRLLNRWTVSEGGAVALLTTLSNNRVTLWRALPGGALTYVLGTGDAITVRGAPATLYGLSIRADSTTAGGGLGAGINDGGTILATLSVGDGVHLTRRLPP